MRRNEFLRSLGAGAAFALTFPCAQGCTKDSPVGEGQPVPGGLDFTIDLNAADASNLQENGGFILRNEVVIVRNLEGNFIAASQICSHQQTDQVRFIEDHGGIFHCFTHGSEFDQQGAPLNTITNRPLKTFRTELNGNILRVFD